MIQGEEAQLLRPTEDEELESDPGTDDEREDQPVLPPAQERAETSLPTVCCYKLIYYLLFTFSEVLIS